MADQFSRLYDVERVGGDQRARLAEMLRAAGQNQPQGQMVSGWYVPPSWSQNLNTAVSGALGTYMGAKLDEERKSQLADLMRQRKEGIAIEQPQAMQNFNGMERMAEGQTPIQQQAPQNELQRITQRPQSADMSQMNPAMAPVQQQRFRPMTQNELDENMMQMYQVDPRMASLLSSMETNRAVREAAKEEKETQRAWQEKRDEENRKFLASEHALTRAVTLAGRTPASEKPLTEFQGKSVMFGTRAAQSHNILNSLEDTTDPLAVKTNQAGGILTNWAMPANVQRVDQAQRDFVNAVLRQESGAAISGSEFENARKQYFPQPGDKPEQIAQKRMNRELAIKGFARQAGPAGINDIMQVYNAGAPQIQSSAPQAPQKQSRLGGLTPPNTQVKFLGFE